MICRGVLCYVVLLVMVVNGNGTINFILKYIYFNDGWIIESVL